MASGDALQSSVDFLPRTPIKHRPLNTCFSQGYRASQSVGGIAMVRLQNGKSCASWKQVRAGYGLPSITTRVLGFRR
jgi:hypothetical protein